MVLDKLPNANKKNQNSFLNELFFTSFFLLKIINYNMLLQY